MSPAFPSFHAFFAMGGYAFYVWLSVSIAILTLAALVLQTRWQRKQLLREIHWQQARKKRIQQARKRSQGEDDANAP